MNKSEQGLCAYFSGHNAENFVREWLEKKGYHFIAQNVRGKKGFSAGELDLIMTDKKTLVFIEVKKRKTLEEAAQAILPSQQKRLYEGASLFLAKNPQFQNWDCRFDAVLVTPNQEPELLKNIIEEQ